MGAIKTTQGWNLTKVTYRASGYTKKGSRIRTRHPGVFLPTNVLIEADVKVGDYVASKVEGNKIITKKVRMEI